jgi:hypothetical protein
MPDIGNDEAPRVNAEQLRRDLAYATAVLEAAKQAAPPSPKPPGVIARFFGFLSSGLGLLLIGTVITSILVPYFQKASEQRQAERSIMRECLGEFLQYEVSIWQEFYAVFPLVHESEIDRAKYDEFTAAISEIKLARYRAYGKVRALAIAFREGSPSPSDIEQRIEEFAILVNQTSERIDTWLGALYCARAICAEAGSGSVNSREILDGLGETMQEVSDAANLVSEMMVRRIQGVESLQIFGFTLVPGRESAAPVARE